MGRRGEECFTDFPGVTAPGFSASYEESQVYQQWFLDQKTSTENAFKSLTIQRGEGFCLIFNFK